MFLSVEVSNLAHEAFIKAIPPRKRTMVLEHLGPAILTLMKTGLQARPETLSDLFDQKDKKLKLLIVVVKDHAKDIGHTAVNQSSQNWESSIWAPFM